MHVITRLNIGGPGRQALMLRRALENRGYDVDLISGAVDPHEGNLPGGDDHYTSLPRMKRSLDPLADLHATQELFRLMRHRRPHIVHTHLSKAGALGRLAARRAKVPVVVHTFHANILSGYFGPSANKTFTAAERAFAHVSDALVAVSDVVRDELLDLGVGKPQQWRVIRVGLDLDHLLDGMPNGEESRRALGLPATDPLVGIVGRLTAIKDHATFIEAAARISSVRPDVHFVVAGDGELRSTLEDRAGRMLGKRVHFLGWVAEMAAVYRALDVVVLTSSSEGTPAVLIEAGAAARPTVASRVGGVADIVLDGVTGSLVPPADPGAVAAKTLSILDASPQQAAEMGAAARDRVRERFSATRLISDLDDLYSELLDHKAIHLDARAEIPSLRMSRAR